MYVSTLDLQWSWYNELALLHFGKSQWKGHMVNEWLNGVQLSSKTAALLYADYDLLMCYNFYGPLAQRESA